MIRVAVIDGHPAMRAGIQALFADRAGGPCPPRRRYAGGTGTGRRGAPTARPRPPAARAVRRLRHRARPRRLRRLGADTPARSSTTSDLLAGDARAGRLLVRPVLRSSASPSAWHLGGVAWRRALVADPGRIVDRRGGPGVLGRACVLQLVFGSRLGWFPIAGNLEYSRFDVPKRTGAGTLDALLAHRSRRLCQRHVAPRAPGDDDRRQPPRLDDPADEGVAQRAAARDRTSARREPVGSVSGASSSSTRYATPPTR